MEELENMEYDILSSAEKRSGVEERWVAFQPYILSKGYRLRPRYNPDWVPSWKASGLRPSSCEDSIDSMPLRVLDATRTDDGSQVMIKMVFPKRGEGEDELAILQHFSRSPLKDSPANHVVPCLDAFPIPVAESGQFVVMPLLGQYDELPFKRIAEVHDFLQQVFEGLLFMHENNIAHCDICSGNIMMNSNVLYNEPFHPVYQDHSLDIQRMVYPQYSRLEKNIRYYLIDMGFASWFLDPNTPRLVTGKSARIMAPEQKKDQLYDPFLVDIYQLGTVIKGDIIPQNSALSFLKPLAEEMTRSEPSARPALIKAKQIMNTAFLGLSGTSYRWPLAPRDGSFRVKGVYFVWGLMSEPERTFTVQWIPGHAHIKGNERADSLANQGTECTPKPIFNRTSTWLKSHATSAARNAWKRIWVKSQQSNHSKLFIPRPPSLKLHQVFAENFLSRSVTSRLVHVITGHGLFGEYRARFLQEDPKCPCEDPLQSVAHLLFNCPHTESQRHLLMEVSPDLNPTTILAPSKG